MYRLSLVTLAFTVSLDVALCSSLQRIKRQTFDFPTNSPDTSDICDNPCLLPYICAPGETCTLNSTSCTYTCVPCDDPLNCHSTNLPDPCDNMAPCNNGGTCVFSEGLIKCVCTEKFSGVLCETENGPTTTQNVITNMTQSVKYCDGFLTCIHGSCATIENGVYCKCDEGFVGDACETGCDLDCGEHGGCYNNGTHQKCNCNYNWVGDDCRTPRPKESNTWIWATIGGCIGAVVVCVLLLLILIFWMWKRRVILAMKIVHFFQPTEDTDGLLFDAFISYKSHPDDEGFVHHQIYQKLEKELNFKLCLHFRDFQVGETISNNILWAVQNSRRTILIISPNYLDSEYARFEYQTAQVETLKYRQRIIPVLYKSIKDDYHKVDRTLKSILETITYIEWAPCSEEKENNKFWKRLVLSLPKRKESKDISKPSSKSSGEYKGSSKLSNIQLVNYKKTENLEPQWTIV